MGHSLYAALELETFKRLWKSSAEDSEDRRCLLRLWQQENYEDDMEGKTGLENMPDVGSDLPTPPQACLSG